ncbi:MAG: tyrosine-protein phosphatase [Lachnospiraceae bacterium]|nr:tyrosine-protein phosphatase [Lachnospiraceae bacterium]
MNISKLLSFEKLHNIRDLGGMKAADGRSIVEGRLVRCGNLSELSENDRDMFASLTDTVIDFRTDVERREKPDIEITGIRYLHIPIVDSLTAGITREKTADREVFVRFGAEPDKARRYMCDMYHAFAESDFAASQYAVFIRLLMQQRKKAFVWHCTAGKDRAGVGSAIIEEILGIARDDIINDYLMTNEYLREEIAFLTEFIKGQAGTDSFMSDEALRYLFGAKQDYIEEYYHTIDSKYGSFDCFIRDGLKLSADDVLKLQSLYLIK